MPYISYLVPLQYFLANELLGPRILPSEEKGKLRRAALPRPYAGRRRIRLEDLGQPTYSDGMHINFGSYQWFQLWLAADGFNFGGPMQIPENQPARLIPACKID
jgi:hypothetical protein